MESNISRIGANDLSMISPTQKRAQQAKYALQLAESDSRSLSYKNSPPKTDDNSARSKPRRVQSTEITIEDNNIISNIGQDSQLMKDRKKQQQQVYAQQLQSQQQHKLQQFLSG